MNTISQRQNSPARKPTEPSWLSSLRAKGEEIATYKAAGVPPVVAEFKAAHPSIAEWNEKFDISAQMKLADRSIPLGAISLLPNDENPGLGLFRHAYGDSAHAWLCMHIALFNMIPQVKTRLSAELISLTANDIFNTHPDLNLGEICVFFARARDGRYGTLYGAVDQHIIMQWMWKFRAERRQEIAEYEKAMADIEAARKKEADANNVCSYPEYYKEALAKGQHPLTPEEMQRALAGKRIQYSEQHAYELLKERDEEFIRRRDEKIRQAERLLRQSEPQ